MWIKRGWTHYPEFHFELQHMKLFFQFKLDYCHFVKFCFTVICVHVCLSFIIIIFLFLYLCLIPELIFFLLIFLTEFSILPPGSLISFLIIFQGSLYLCAVQINYFCCCCGCYNAHVFQAPQLLSTVVEWQWDILYLFFFVKDVKNDIIYACGSWSVPQIIIHGPPAAGKRTMVRIFS